jgi:adenylate cyclase
LESNKKSARWQVSATVVILACALAMLFSEWSPVMSLENKTVDWRLRFRVPNFEAGKEVAVVLIDDVALEAYPYRSPIPRDLLAKLINVLTEAGAKRIGLDVFLKDLSWEDEDEVLVESFRASGLVTLVSTFRKSDGKIIWDLPHSKFLESVDSTGVADLPIDPSDQIVRQATAIKMGSKITVPTLAGAMLLTSKMPEVGKVDAPQIIQSDLPLFARDGKRFIIDYLGPPSSVAQEEYAVKTFPASGVASGLLPKDWFAGKYVFIGAGFSGNTDTFRTSYYSGKYEFSLTPEVEIHANVLATLLSEGKLKPPTELEKLGTIFLMTLGSVPIAFSFAPAMAAFFTVVYLTGFVFATFAIFEGINLLLPMIPVSLAVGFAFMGTMLYRLTWEGRQKRWIKNAFQMYLSPEFVETLAKRPEQLNLGGEERELTIMFTDLQGFTAISESVEPKELINLLSEYFEGMTEILFKHGGTLDKYVGDAIMAFWNAPANQSDHAERSALAALDMIEFTEQVNRSFQNNGKPELRTRIGINTGKAIVGNVGSNKRFNYTVMGDVVNLAARLESVNKQYGTFLTVSEATYDLVCDKVYARKLDVVCVKGKTQPVSIYELIGRKGKPLDSKLARVIEAYYEGLEAYNRWHWETAIHHFIAALQIDPKDGPSKVYLERCRALRDNPPNKDWDGVFNLLSK